MKRLVLQFLNSKKFLSSALVVLSLSGCVGNLSLTKEVKIPSWYLNAPVNNTVFIYGEGESMVSVSDAKNNALNSMASKLVVSVGSSISSTTRTSSNSIGNSYSKDVTKDVRVNVEKIKFTNATTEKSANIKESFYVLLKVNRQELFENKKKEFDIRDSRIDTKYNSLGKYSKLEQIHILQTLYPTIKKAKTQSVPTSKTPRGKSGFHLYMADIKDRVTSELRSNLKKGEKLTGGAVISEASKRWRNLPECSRSIWNNKAGK